MRHYRQVLAVPGLRHTLLSGFLVKLAVIAIPIVFTLQVSVGLGRSLAAAGLVIGVWLAGTMAGSVVAGRAIDRWGLRPVVLVSALAQGAFWSVAALLPYPVLVVAAVLDGLLLVTGSTVVRLAMARAPEPYRPAGFALDTLTTQVSYLIGPALAATLATQISPAAATRALGALLLAGGLVLAATAPNAIIAKPRHRPPRLRPSARLLAILACTVAAGVVASGFEISVVATLRAQGAMATLGLLLAACGAYAIVGSLLAGGTARPVRPWAVTALLGAAAMPLGLVTDWRLLLLAVAPAAMLSAAAFATTAAAASAEAPADAEGQTLGLYGAALSAGNSAGAPIAGLAGSSLGPGWGFTAAGSVALAVGLLASLPLRSRAPLALANASKGIT
ncbi:hypothetical protein Vqi01_39330 [Micromonospora qiuiae]|uniref:Major facilitator superfamily (MFS) profile domain-containing protein n=1 Tax=Micromonospora qiuiae TaxID=502268 RepID=A0ABQ4JEX7_9ACTN|nr:MFS transporter [Micromonospora qiuiae]GIJ28771.1 hypothetical protein Vqi01_39330 [Micromonospora qiuiae]